MVELQGDDVGLPAIYARVRAKVLADERAVLLAVSLDPANFSTDIDIAVADVVLAAVGRMTRATPCLSRASRLIGEREGFDRLDESAVIATLRFDDGQCHEGPLRSGSALRSA